MSLLYTNNAQTTLAAPLSTTDTELTVIVGMGDLFPETDEGDNGWFPLTLIKADGSGFEVVRAIGRDDDVIVIERGQENTPVSLEFDEGDVVSLRMTSAAFDTMLRDGVETATILKGVNAAVQTNAISDPYEISLDNVTELVDGLRISFKPFTTNDTTSPSIKLNDTEAKTILIPYTSNTLMPANTLSTDQMYEFQYSADRDRWLITTPLNLTDAFATILTAGTVELPTIEDDEAVYDVDTNPASYSGAPVAFTRTGISKIIKNHSEVRTFDLDNMWIQNAQGGFPQNVRTTDDNFLVGSETTLVSTFTLESGEQMRCGDVNIVRASTSITLSGTVILGAMTRSRNPMCFAGPAGEAFDLSTITSTNAELYYTEEQKRSMGKNDSSPYLSLLRAIKAGESMTMFHGGHGGGPINDYDDRVQDDAHPKGRGGILFFAPKIRLGSSCKLYLPVRLSNAYSDSSERDGEIFDGDTEVPPDTTAGGGGVIIFVTEDFAYDPLAKAMVGDPAGDYVKIDDQAPTLSIPALELFEGAQTGKIFHLNPVTQVLTAIV